MVLEQMKKTLLTKFIKESTKPEGELLKEIKIKVGKFNWSVNELSQGGRTPLHQAIYSGYNRIVSYLLDEGADLNACSIIAHAPLVFAISCKNEEAAITLINRGANISEIFDHNTGHTPLHFASSIGLNKVVSALVKKLPKHALNLRDSKCLTAAQLTILSGGYTDVLKTLHEAGADLTATIMPPLEHPNCLELALSLGHYKASEYLLNNAFGMRALSKNDEANPFVTVKNAISIKKKIPFYNLLLSAGAGLVSANIPDEVLELYKLNRKNLGPFVIYAQHTKTRKGLLITNLKSLKKGLEDGSYLLDIAKLANTLHEYEGQLYDKQYSHVAALKDYSLKGKSCPRCQNPNEQDVNNVPDMPKLLLIDTESDYSSIDIEFYETQALVSFKEHATYLIDEIDSVISNVFENENISSPNVAIYPFLISKSVFLLNVFLNHIAMAKSKNGKIRGQAIAHSSSVLNLLIPLYKKCLYHFMVHGKYEECIELMLLFEMATKNILNNFSTILKSKHIAFLNRLQQSRAFTISNMADCYNKLEKKEQALSLAEKAMRLFAGIHDSFFHSDISLFQGITLLVMIDVYISEGWHIAAVDLLQRACTYFEMANTVDVRIIASIKALLDAQLTESLGYYVIKAVINLQKELEKNITNMCEMELLRYSHFKKFINEYIDYDKLLVTQQKLLLQYIELAEKTSAKMFLVKKGELDAFSIIVNLKAGSKIPPKNIQNWALMHNKNCTYNNSDYSVTIHLDFINERRLELLLIGFKDMILKAQMLIQKQAPDIHPNRIKQPEQSKDNNAIPCEELKKLTIDKPEPENSHTSLIKNKEKKISNEAKVKTRGASSSSNANQNQVDKEKLCHVMQSDSPFHRLDGYSPIIPIEGGNLPSNKLYITISEHSSFTPFLALVRDNQTKQYYPNIKSVASKGLNQQGVKLSTIKDTQSNQEISIARLKICGSGGEKGLRAFGRVTETIKTKEGVKKLYVVDQIINKKKEARIR